jgi:DNA-binding beta-propeller fold protein YncE
MKKIFCIFSVYLIFAGLPGPAGAGVDWQASKTIKPDGAPIDIAISSDGKQTFVLNEGGKLQIYDQRGKLIDTIEVDPSMNHIASDGSGSRLLLSSTKKGTVNEIQVEYVVNFSYDGSPFIGSSDAPVVLAVFSDFQ